jgi:hypothetical protein
MHMDVYAIMHDCFVWFSLLSGRIYWLVIRTTTTHEHESWNLDEPWVALARTRDRSMRLCLRSDQLCLARIVVCRSRSRDVLDGVYMCVCTQPHVGRHRFEILARLEQVYLLASCGMRACIVFLWSTLGV